METDWDICPAVERDPEKLSGALSVCNTRTHVATLFENLKQRSETENF